ncbi:DUF58 domain-containing protein [candidate division WOR-3 bacterium]|nr:DUF58 domain-containing protein [candidate division WOR-3 bacterium]
MPNYLDPKILSRIKSMELRAKLVVEGFLVGMHRSPYHGFSVEFAEHRPYQSGDELRRIDWKVYARQERFYTKQFEEETNLRAYIILDTSNSMAYSSSGLTKFEYGAYLSASLAWLLIYQKDAVSFTLFDEEIKHYSPPSSTQTHLSNIMQVLEKARTSQKTKIPSVLNEIAAKIKKRGLIIFISDLLAPETEVIDALKIFRHKKNEVIVFHILDPAELDFPFKESMIFKDIETSDELPAGEEIKLSYQREVHKFIETYKQGFYSHNIDYLLLPSSEPLEKSLTFYLSKRRKIGLTHSSAYR